MEKVLSRRSFLKAASVGAGLAVALPALSACAPGAAPSGGQAVQPSAGGVAAPSKIQIRFMARAGNLGDFHRHVSEQYKEKHPNIDLKVEDTGWNDLQNKVLMQAVAGVLQDVVYQWTSAWAPYLAKQGVWMPLDDLKARRRIRLTFLQMGCIFSGHLVYQIEGLNQTMQKTSLMIQSSF